MKKNMQDPEFALGFKSLELEFRVYDILAEAIQEKHLTLEQIQEMTRVPKDDIERIADGDDEDSAVLLQKIIYGLGYEVIVRPVEE